MGRLAARSARVHHQMSVGTYPRVRGEFETIAKLQAGYSIARFGDGELKMAHGNGYRRQEPREQLAAQLQKILARPSPMCLVGIPTMYPAGPKYEGWLRHRDRFLPLLSDDVTYYSAFITRPDSAPWIETQEYCEAMQSLWAGKRVAVLCERKGSIFRAVKPAARQAVHIECPHVGAWDVRKQLKAEILAVRPDVVIMSAGPAATCLADTFASMDVQAIDLGSVGAMVCRVLGGRKR